jgi:hypothetical protein
MKKTVSAVKENIGLKISGSGAPVTMDYCQKIVPFLFPDPQGAVNYLMRLLYEYDSER